MMAAFREEGCFEWAIIADVLGYEALTAGRGGRERLIVGRARERWIGLPDGYRVVTATSQLNRHRVGVHLV